MYLQPQQKSSARGKSKDVRSRPLRQHNNKAPLSGMPPKPRLKAKSKQRHGAPPRGGDFAEKNSDEAQSAVNDSQTNINNLSQISQSASNKTFDHIG